MKEEKKSPGIVGITRNEHGIALSYAKLEGDDYCVSLCEYAPIPEAQQIDYARAWVARNKIKQADCHYLLDETQYELQLLETPPVEQEELLEAVRWRLKDLITLPVDNAIIDVFPLPEDAYRGRLNMLYAAAASKETIEACILFIKKVGLTPNIIDIPEMALRNIALYLPEMDFGTVAILHLRETHGDMLMYSHDAMYLSRQIEMGFSSLVSKPTHGGSLDNSVMLERLGLDLQRSLDYYESQLGKGIATKIYILPFEDETVSLAPEIDAHINTPVTIFNYREFLPVDDELHLSYQDQARCLPVIGVVLRRES